MFWFCFEYKLASSNITKYISLFCIRKRITHSFNQISYMNMLAFCCKSLYYEAIILTFHLHRNERTTPVAYKELESYL